MNFYFVLPCFNAQASCVLILLMKRYAAASANSFFRFSIWDSAMNERIKYRD